MPLVAPTTAAYSNRIASLAISLAAGVDSRIAGETPSVAKPIFVGYNSSTPVSTRNADCWINGVSGITAISPWNDYSENFYNGIWIANDVLIMANHAQIPNGTNVDAVTTDNTRVTRAIVTQMRVGSTDIQVCRTAALPGTITPAKVFSSAAYEYFTRAVNYGDSSIPTFYTNTDEEALVADFSTINSSVLVQIPSDATRLGFYEALAPGSSGGPICAIYNGELVALSTFHHWSASAGDGPSINANITAIRAAMATLGCTGTISEISI